MFKGVFSKFCESDYLLLSAELKAIDHSQESQSFALQIPGTPFAVSHLCHGPGRGVS